MKQIFTKPDHFPTRLLMMCIGIIVQALGMALLIRVDLGTDPFTTFCLGVIQHIPVSFGTWLLIFNTILFIPVIIFDLKKIGLGTIGNMVFLGYIVDFFSWILNQILPVNFFDSTMICWILLIPSLLLFMGGASCYLCSDLGAAPNDALPFIISNRCPRFSFRVIRVTWDTTLMVLGFLIGGKLGIVTILTAFCLGPMISWMKKKLSVFLI